MNDEPPPPSGSQVPVSAFLSSVDELIAGGSLSAPGYPGQLAALDRFELLRLVGAGGMGLVFLARDSASGEKVAIKFVKPSLLPHPQVIARFRNEASRLQRLAHSQLVPVLEVSSDEQKPYFVMPFFERSLAGEIAPDKPMPTDRVRRVALDVARALAHVHSRNLVHGDLKPANVLLDAAGGARLGDFGLSLALNDPLIDADRFHFAGTAAYVSPQLARREGEDTRRDIYAFGALLYEMLTGRPPYQGETTELFLERIRSGPPPPIRALQPKADPHLAAIAETAMAREHRDRYANMADVVSDLERAARGQAPRRVRRGAERRAMLSGAALAAVVAALAFLMWPRRAGEQTRQPPPAATPGPRLEILRRFEIPVAADWVNAVPCNADKDELADLAVTTRDSWLLVAGTGQILSSAAPLEPLVMGNIGAAADVDGDGFDEVFFGWTAETNLHLAAFNVNRTARQHFHAVGTGCINPHGRQDYSGLSAHAIVDLERDGRRELLAIVDTGWCKAPRALCCFDLATGQTRWQFPIAPSPKAPVWADLDRDGRLDIVLGSYAVSNGNRLMDGTDDAHCYVYAVAADGRLLWRREVETTYVWAHPMVTQTAGDREPAVFIWLEATAVNRKSIGQREIGRIVRLHPADGRTLERFDAGVRLLSCLAEDLDGDGRPEILATDRTGSLHVLDLMLRTIRSVKVASNEFTGVHLKLAAVTNLTSATDRFVILTSAQEQIVQGGNSGARPELINLHYFHDVKVLVLDTKLRPVAQHVLWNKLTLDPGLAVRLLNMDADAQPEIVTLSGAEPPRVLKFLER
jgi:hypothetical protein